MTNSTEIASKSEDMKRYFWDRVKRNDFTLSKFLKHIEYAAGESTNAISDLEACVARAEANIVDLRDASQKTKLSKVLETVTESICQAKEGKDVVWKSHWEDLASQLRIKTQAGKRQAAAGDVLVLEEEERAIQATQRKRSRDAVAAPNLAVDSREDLGNQPKKSKCASFDDDDDSAECIVNGEIQTQDADGNVVALSVDYLQKTFVGNKKAVSAEDLICGKVNLSEWLRSTQSALVRKYSTQPTVAFSLQEIGHILLLHHIILFSEKYRISTWTTHKDPRIVKAWSRLVSAEQMERMDARLPENVRDALQNFFHELSSGGNFMDIWKKHTAEHMKIIEDNMPWRMLIVVRSFYLATQKMKQLQLFTQKVADEDTTVHALLHGLMEEIFDVDSEHLLVVWANGESKSSREQRKQYVKNPAGKKPDCRVISKDFEEVFMETKSHRHTSNSPASVYDLYKLAILLQGAVIAKTKKGLHASVFGIQLLRESVEIYEMSLAKDGIFTMYHIASCVIPKSSKNLELLSRLIGSFLYVKKKLDQQFAEHEYDSEEELALHLSSPIGSPEFEPELDPKISSVRPPVPTPKKKKSNGIPNFLE